MKSSSDTYLARVYFLLTALGFLAHMEWGNLTHLTAPNIILIPALIWAVSAVGVLLWPDRIYWIALMCLGQIFDVALTLPQVPNHWLLAFFVSLTWLCSISVLLFKNRKWPSVSELFSRNVSSIRFGVIVFYLFTGFWKLNTAFFQPQISCVVTRFLEVFSSRLGFPSSGFLGYFLIFSTLFFEILIPVFLIFQKTKVIAAFALITFHFVLALDAPHNYQNFSWTMVPLLITFFEPEMIESLLLRPSRFRVSWFRFFATALSLGLVLLAFLSPRVWFVARWVFSTALIAGILAVVLGHFIAVRPFKIDLRPSWKITNLRVIGVFSVLIFLNGIAPILGVKNRNSWQMYSNIRIESDYSNHFLIRRSLDLFGFQRKNVEIVATSDKKLFQDYTQVKKRMTWHDLNTYVASHPTFSISWREFSTIFDSKDSKSDPRFEKPNLLLRKLVWFRPIGEGVEKSCTW